jgi:hypothetical protein
MCQTRNNNLYFGVEVFCKKLGYLGSEKTGIRGHGSGFWDAFRLLGSGMAEWDWNYSQKVLS